jgi:hypothetical protein
MVPVTISVSAADLVAPHPTARIVSVYSNQDTNATGDGNTSVDWQVTDALMLNLRAERSGAAGDRTYSIVISVADVAGNHATTTVTVRVPHNQAQ